MSASDFCWINFIFKVTLIHTGWMKWFNIKSYYHPTCTPMAWQPTCLPAQESPLVLSRRNSVLVQERDGSRDQARSESLVLNPTEFKEEKYVELILEALQERTRRPGWYVVLFCCFTFQTNWFSPPIGGVTKVSIYNKCIIKKIRRT